MYVAYVDCNGDLVEYETGVDETALSDEYVDSLDDVDYYGDDIPAYEYDDEYSESYEWED